MNKALDRSGYRSIAKDSILFVVIFCLMNLTINSFFDMYNKKIVLCDRDEAFYKQIRQTKTIILGDSHQMDGIERMKGIGVFNYANASEDYLQSYFRLKEILNNKDSDLSSVIISFEPHNFYRKLNSEKYLFYWSHKIDLHELIFEMGLKDKIYITSLFLYRYVNYFSRLQQVLDKSHKSLNKPKPPSESSSYWKNKKILGRKLTQRMRYHYSGDLNKDMVLAFERLINLALASNLKVILLQMPVSDYYYNRIPKKTKQEFFKYRRELLRNNVELRYLNYRDFFPSDFESHKIYFKNSDHLNNKGRRILTEKLKKDLEAIIN